MIAIVQARMGSTRLPGKVLADIAGRPMIGRLFDQMRGARTLDAIVLATSVAPSDDALAAWARAEGVPVFRGALEDVLGRYCGAAREYRADVVVRLTGDCPLHTPDTVDEVVDAFLASEAEFASNTDPYTRPDGLDVEVMSVGALERACAKAPAGPDREHVTPFLRRDVTTKRLPFIHLSDPSEPQLRWTVDELADLEHARRVWSALDRSGPGPHSYETVMNATITTRPADPAGIANWGYYKSLWDAASGDAALPLRLEESERWLARSAALIPGGAQTYSKSWRQHIRGVSPLFLSHGEGAYVWDVDGNRYVDLIQGLLPNILGYACESVDRAAFEQTRRGHSFSLPTPLEVELAERLIKHIPCAEMVRFGKNGSDATAGAIRVARGFTKRERVAVCGYHGWQDWYIGSTSRWLGVPSVVRELTHAFPYGDASALDQLLCQHPDEFAAVIMEPVTFFWPADGYLADVREVVHRHGALLVFDEICTGFRLGLGGAQERFGVVPDLATFGKAMGNGYAISCVVGRKDVMQLFEDVFVSFTFAGDASSMAAAMAVLDILEKSDAYEKMDEAGGRLADGTRVLAEEAGLADRIQVHGDPRWSLLRFTDAGGAEDAVLRALWQQEVVRRGVLITMTHNVCAALDFAAVDHVLRAYAETFKYIERLLRVSERLEEHLAGPIPTPAFRARA